MSRHLIECAWSGIGAVKFDFAAMLSTAPMLRGSFPRSDGSAKATERERTQATVRRNVEQILMADSDCDGLIQKLQVPNCCFINKSPMDFATTGLTVFKKIRTVREKGPVCPSV